MAHDAMPDRDTIADDRVGVGMQYGIVLHIGAFADLDAARIRSYYCAGPDAGVGTDGDIADDVGGLDDVRGRFHYGLFAVKFA